MSIISPIRRLFRLSLTDEELERALRALMAEGEPDPIVREDDGEVNKQQDSQGKKRARVSGSDLPDDLLPNDEIARRFGYTPGSPHNWARHPSGIVKKYYPEGNSRPYYSLREVEVHLSRHASGPRGPRSTGKDGANGSNGRSLVGSSAEPIMEFDTVKGAARRLRIRPAMIQSLIAEGHIWSIEFHNRTIVSVREIEALGAGQRYLPNMSLFETKEWLPLVDACQELGLPYEEIRNAVSAACEHGEIANRVMGRLRFVHLRDLEKWYLAR